MRRRMLVVLGCTVLLLALASVMCSADAGLNGKSETNFAAAWAKVSDVSATAFVGEYGKFIASDSEIKVGLLYANVEGINLLAIAPSYVYYFNAKPGASTVPYLGAGFYYAKGTAFGDSTSNTNYQFSAGVKYFLGGGVGKTDRTLYAEYRFLKDVLKSDENLSTVIVGISNLF